MIAISVVPPPTSTTIEPHACSTGIPAPIAAAIGSSIKRTSRAPALNTASRMHDVQPKSIYMGHTPQHAVLVETNVFMHFTNKLVQHGSVTSKSAITPSFIGRIAEIFAGVRPNICLASRPTAATIFVNRCDESPQLLVHLI